MLFSGFNPLGEILNSHKTFIICVFCEICGLKFGFQVDLAQARELQFSFFF